MPPHGNPPYHPSEVPQRMAQLSAKMTHQDRQILSETGVGGVRHGVRRQLEEWNIMVGQPRRFPALIGNAQAPTAVHGPYNLLPSYLLHRGSAPCVGGTVTIRSQS